MQGIIRRASRRAMLLASVMTMALPAVATAQAPVAGTVTASTEDLAEVVVTARKRAEKLNDVPASVTAFTEADIEARGIVNPRDFIAATPGVTFIETQNVGTSFVIIRGIAQARNSEPSVAVVVDGVQQINPSQFNQSLFDLEQIEVLKGPQGGLYGRNAIGGAILITTKQPTDDYQFKSKVGVDNGPGVTVQQSASGPIPGSDTLKFAASVQYQDTDGYIKNVYLDQSADPYRDVSGHFKLAWRPNENFSADARVSFSNVNTTAFYYNIVNNVNDVSVPVQVNNKGIDNRDMVDASLKMDYNLGSVTATSVTAFDKLTEILTGDAFDFKPIKQSFLYKLFGIDLNQSQYLNVSAVSQDLRFASSSSGPLHWIAGAYAVHTDRYIANGNMIDTGNGVTALYYNPSTNPLNPSTTFLADSENNWAWALYADADYDITDQIQLATSLRYDSDHRADRTLTPTAFLPNVPGFAQEATGQVRAATFGAIQPKITLRYKPDAADTLYADWGRGFRSGGFNQAGVGGVAAENGILGVADIFRAEVANTWEVGAKSELFGKRVLVDAALYYTTSHNPYFFVYLATNSTQNLGNITEVVYKGLDFSSTVKLTDELQANIGFGYTNSDITQAVDRTWIGNQAPDVSRYNFTSALQYRKPIGSDDQLVSRIEYQRIGSTWWDPQNSTVRNPVDLVNARMAFSAGQYEIAAWSKNLFDKKYNAEFSPGGFVFKALPRTFGMDATVWF